MGENQALKKIIHFIHMADEEEFKKEIILIRNQAMKTEETIQDREWMQRALELAKQGLGTTSPNPPVGAVIVKGGRVLGEGYHKRAGEPHAERCAIQDACERGHEGELQGATLYVTLEPCSSYGRTPPCTDAILERGIGRVVYGAVDPDKRHRGRADALLRSEGVQVQGRVAEEACRAILEPWAHTVENGRPWVMAKIAATMDGRIVRKNERWLSSEEALRYAHQLRAESDAILVGGETVRCDKPALTIRRPLAPVAPDKKQPWRIVLTRDRTKLPKEAPLFADENAERTLIYENVGDLKAMLEELYGRYGIVRLMLECGGNLLREFLEQDLVNEWVQVVTPYLSGGKGMLVPGDYLLHEKKMRDMETIVCGNDVILRGKLT